MLGPPPQVFPGGSSSRRGQAGSGLWCWAGGLGQTGGGQRWSQHLEVQREEAGSQNEPGQRPPFSPWKCPPRWGEGVEVPLPNTQGCDPLTLTVVGDLLEHNEHPSWGQDTTAVQTEPPAPCPRRGQRGSRGRAPCSPFQPQLQHRGFLLRLRCGAGAGPLRVGDGPDRRAGEWPSGLHWAGPSPAPSSWGRSGAGLGVQRVARRHLRGGKGLQGT